ncbi:MAG: acyl carrier protein [Pseudomonadota bacterium]
MAELNSVMEAIAESGVMDDMSKFDPDKTFKENGIDSLDVMSLFLAVEEKFGIKFSEEEVGQINTAAELVKALNAR